MYGSSRSERRAGGKPTRRRPNPTHRADSMHRAEQSDDSIALSPTSDQRQANGTSTLDAPHSKHGHGVIRTTYTCTVHWNVCLLSRQARPDRDRARLGNTMAL